MRIDDEDLQAYKKPVQNLREKYEVVEPFWVNEETGEIVTEKEAYSDFDISSIMKRSNKQREETQAVIARHRAEGDAKRAEGDKMREKVIADAEKRRKEVEEKQAKAKTEASIKEGVKEGRAAPSLNLVGADPQALMEAASQSGGHVQLPGTPMFHRQAGVSYGRRDRRSRRRSREEKDDARDSG